MNAFPAVTLTTDRLVLRPFGAGDVDAVAAACSDELTQRWLPLPRPYGTAEAHAWCTEFSHASRRSGDGIDLAVIRGEDGVLAGCVGLKRTDWAGRVTGIGYWSAPATRGNGLLTEAVLALSRWALAERQLERVELLAATGNLPSRRVAERAGFQREGVMRNAGYTHDGRVDLVLYSLVPRDLS